MFDANNNCELRSVNLLSEENRELSFGQSETTLKTSFENNQNQKMSTNVDIIDENSTAEQTPYPMPTIVSATVPNMSSNLLNDAAVEVVKVAFKYQQSEVLQNINITVPSGQIYALLGPSGSGKTTLLRLILGRIKPKSGSIYVFGNSRPGFYNRHIGYMPQDKALSPELTIGETIDYFASLYGISRKRLQKQKIELRKVLQLSPDDQVVSTLSGGQQKALSLSLVFLHSPRLVILDEPTVGTDPLLGDQIWDYLRKSCAQGLTVIIVTHYIQEAALAQSVGMMRNGRIIEEGTPQSLYEKYCENDLEKIFIKICTDRTLLQQQAQAQQLKGAEALQQNICNFLSYDTHPGLVNKDDNQLRSNDIHNDMNNNNNSMSKNNKIHSNSNNHYGHQAWSHNHLKKNHNENNDEIRFAFLWLLFILVRRNIQKFFASKLLAILMLSPVYCTLLMCMSFKVDKVLLPIAVYDDPISGLSGHSERFLQIAKNFSVYYFDYKKVSSKEDAIRMVQRGDCMAAIWFDKNFTESLEIRALASTAQQKYEKKNHATNASPFGGETTILPPTTSFSTIEAITANQNENFDKKNLSKMIQSSTDKGDGMPITSTESSLVLKVDDDSSTSAIKDGDESSTETNDFDYEITTEVDRKKRETSNENDVDKFDETTTKNSSKTIKNDEDKTENEEDEEEEEEEEESEDRDDPDHGLISNATLKSSSIHIAIDHSNAILSRPAFDLFQYSTWTLFNEVILSHDRYPIANPVVVHEVIYAEGTDAPDFLLSGYMIGFLYLSQVTLTAQLLIQERKDGFFDRAIVAGAKHSLMFFSHFITNMIFALMQTLLMSLIGFVWYKIPNFGSYYLVFVLVMLQSASSIMTGLFISSICRESFSAFFLALSITLSQLFTSGAVFPIISFDPLLKFLMNISPIAMPVESLRNVMLRGWDLSYFHVYHGFTTNIVTTIFFGILALVFFIRSS